MRNLLALAGAAALVALTPAVAHADDAASVAKVGRLVFSSDGKRLGRIDRVEPTRVGIIVDSAYVYVPVTTLTAGENNRVLTSLSFKEAARR